MIEFLGIKDFLLESLFKAVKLHKDRSKLVQVERTVTNKNGTTFIMKVWVRPDEVKKTDIVIGGHKNLDPSHPSHKHGANLPAKVSTKVTDPSRKVGKSFENKFNGNNMDFFEALEQMGISWGYSNDHRSHLMQARNKLNKLIESGFDVHSEYQKILDHIDEQRENVKNGKHPDGSPKSENDSNINPDIQMTEVDSNESITDSVPEVLEEPVAEEESSTSNSIEESPVEESVPEELNELLENPVNSTLEDPNNLEKYDYSSNTFSESITHADANEFLMKTPTFDIKNASSDSDVGQWENKITNWEQRAVYKYTKHSRDLQRTLRGTNILNLSYGNSHIQTSEYASFVRQIQQLDNAIKKFNLSKNMTVFRVMETTPELVEQLKSGFFHDDGFMSTSLREEVDPDLREKFVTRLAQQIMLKIKVPAGEGRGMYLAPFSEYPKQCEFLIGRGANFRVTGIKDLGNGNWEFECELIGFQKKKLSTLEVNTRSGSPDEPYAHQTIYVDPHTSNAKTEPELVAEFENLPEDQQMEYSDFTTYARDHYFVSDLFCDTTTEDVYFNHHTHEWDQERVEKVHNPIIQKILDSGDTPPPGQKPILYLVGGGPGSGKSSVASHLIDPLKEQLGLKFASLDADEIKEEIPELGAMYKQYKGTAHARTHRESQDIQRKAFDALINSGKCIVQQGIVANVPTFDKIIDRAVNAGYEVRAIGVDVPVEEAIKRASKRARVMKDSTIANSHEDFAKNFLTIATNPGVSSFQLWDNSQPAGQPPTCMFDSEVGILDNKLCEKFKKKGGNTHVDFNKLVNKPITA